jgi:hypothetical protein
MPYAVKFYAYIFVANVLAVIIVAMGQAFRLRGKHSLRFGVCLSDDCHRSVAVWAEGVVIGESCPTND